MKVVFFGTPQIAANILKGLLDRRIEVVCVVTKPDKKKGRSQKMLPPPVKSFVQESFPEIEILQPHKVSTDEYAEKLKAYEADLFIVVAYGEIVKQNILDIPKVACVNVHASLLPRHRGAAPMHRAIINGDLESGVSIMEMVLALDAGDVYNVLKTPITIDMNVGDLEKKIEKLGIDGLIKTIGDFKEGVVKKVPQDESKVTYASKISVEECEVNWDKEALSIHNLIRGVSPYPGAYCFLIMNDQKKRLKIKKARLFEDASDAPSGTVLHFDQNGFIIKAKDSAVELLEVQLEGKKAVGALEFVRGYSKPSLA
ncbi:MAG: Methionyl-tRNA formyltransferase [Chlamydiia bacterium]|nr:Methionyl-tRNA formyltransferase [Chlamydiia bacterium]